MTPQELRRICTAHGYAPALVATAGTRQSRPAPRNFVTIETGKDERPITPLKFLDITV